jgi:zinc transporter, ZIP family
VLQAALIGALAQSSLILSGLVVYAVHIPPKVVGALAGYGAGALLGAIAFDLIPESEVLDTVQTAIWLLVGAAVFVVADRIVETRFGAGGGAGPLGIVVGSVVDGVPESLIFGIQLASGQPLSISFLTAVFVSNIPQALAPSVDLAKSGWSPIRLGGMWAVVVIVCGLTAGLGFFLADAMGLAGGRAAAFAAGGLLAMMTNSLMPFAFQRGGAIAGVMTVVGFAVSLASS